MPGAGRIGRIRPRPPRPQPCGEPMRPDASMARRRTTMPKRISVVIPFFQRKRGLLREAVRSVACQYLPWSAEVELIVVDDGSPVAAQLDLDNLALPDWIRLRILRQANAGDRKSTRLNSSH